MRKKTTKKTKAKKKTTRKKSSKKVMDSESLGVLVNAASELDMQEKIDNEQAVTDGRRSELDDLPPGHPLRLMDDAAKARYEFRQEFEEERRLGDAGIRKTRKAKKAKSAKTTKAERQRTAKQHQEAAKEWNKNVENLAIEIVKVGKTIGKIKPNLIGAARVKATRLDRFLRAVYRGVVTSKISVTVGDEE